MTDPNLNPDEVVVTGAGDEPAPVTQPAEEAEQDRVAAVERQRDEYLDHLRRLAADFDNYKKRQARLAEQQTAQAGARILRSLLPVLDDLDRSLDALTKAGVDETLRGGVVLTSRALRELLTREGLAEIAPDGLVFDPREHEALMAQPTAEAAEGTVLAVVQPGWRLGEQVIRPARVVVAAAAEEAAVVEGGEG
ncbi:MAG: molecular chaperone GrpE [Gaiellales bacterium]|jgi:molecular chaperone GrpE|nr:molecular chaperone GrpE [Gaiellales bacterium]MDX6618748.1 molecular chaperone GrpE [Gaiellales bacterium]